MSAKHSPKNWKQKVTNAFDKGAEKYDQNNELQLKVAEILAKKLPEKNKPNILEIGCGTGVLTRHLIKKYPNASFDITDISPQMLAHTQKQFAHTKNMRFKIMDGEAPCTDQKYDLIISSMSFQWFEHKNQSILQLTKLLTASGQLHYAVPLHTSFKEWRSTLASMNLQAGLMDKNEWPGIQTQKSITIDYGNTLNFLRTLKAIGAHTPQKTYKTISPRELKQACAINDENHGSKATWDIGLFALNREQ